MFRARAQLPAGRSSSPGLGAAALGEGDLAVRRDNGPGSTQLNKFVSARIALPWLISGALIHSKRGPVNGAVLGESRRESHPARVLQTVSALEGTGQR